jgi:hypothetical protein
MRLSIILAVLLTGCATQHRPPSNDIRSLYIDCTNKRAFETYYEKQLQLTNFKKVENDPVERDYYNAIKDRLWTLRSVCR